MKLSDNFGHWFQTKGLNSRLVAFEANKSLTEYLAHSMNSVRVKIMRFAPQQNLSSGFLPMYNTNREMRWPSGRASDSGARGRGSKPTSALFYKTLYSLKVLVIPRKRCLLPDKTETLLTGTLSLNTNKQHILSCKATEDG